MQKRPKLDAQRGGGSSPTDSECEAAEAFPADLHQNPKPVSSVAARCSAVAGVQVRVGGAGDKRNVRVSLEDLESSRSRM